MLRQADWPWVRDWAGRIFLALVCFATFGYLTAMPIIRPGGVMDTLPNALLFGAAVASVGTAVSAAVLAFVSARRGGTR